LALTEMLASTENIGVDKMLASTKYSHRQNSCADRNLTLTKISHRQNVGACAKASPYCLARQSPQQLTSPKPHINDLLHLPESDEPSICSRQVCRCNWSPCFYGGPLPAMYRLVIPARHTENVTNIGVDTILAPAKISLIFTKL
jgi:hypothetical protein